MTKNDIEGFTELMDGLAEYYRQNPVGKTGISIYFSALEKYDLADIAEAVSNHVRDPKHGSFYPKASDIIRHIEGPQITPEQIISEARNPTTPLGCLARMKIGHFDLARQSDAYLKQRAMECLLYLPTWKAQAAKGNYDFHELNTMKKYDVNPLAPLAPGLPGPPAQARLENEQG